MRKKKVKTVGRIYSKSQENEMTQLQNCRVPDRRMLEWGGSEVIQGTGCHVEQKFNSHFHLENLQMHEG